MRTCSFILNEISDVLETSDGRDKVLRSLCYISKLAGSLANNESNAGKLQKFSKEMSRTRNIVQLLDDIPMLKHTIEYGFGREEPEKFMSVLGVLTNVVDHIGYTIEKVTWLSQTDLITLRNLHSWETLNSVCKILSIYFIFMRTLRYIILLHRKIHTDQKSSERCRKSESLEWITLTRLSLDFTHAVNSLPPGFLWSGKIDTFKIGIIGTLSSVLAVYQIFVKRAVQSKYKEECGLF